MHDESVSWLYHALSASAALWAYYIYDCFRKNDLAMGLHFDRGLSIKRANGSRSEVASNVSTVQHSVVSSIIDYCS